MSQDIEQIYDQALQELEQGRSKADVLSKYPASTEELERLLNLSLALSAMPKKEIPQPAMQRKYILAPARRVWLQWAAFSRFAAVSTSVLLLAALVGGTGYAAKNSVPGEALFAVKKATEHLQLQLTTNPESKLSLQLEIAQSRLADAQTAINNTQTDPQKQTAALNELAQETKNTADAISQTSGNKTANLSPAQNQPLIASLENITTKQQTLLNNIVAQPKAGVDPSVLSAAKDNITKVAAIQKSLEIAVNEQALASLPSNPNAITATGTIASLTNNSVTVGTSTYALSDQTIVKDAANTSIKPSDLLPQDQIKITGDKTDKGLLARQITVLATASTTSGSVKGAVTLQPAATSTKLSAKIKDSGQASSSDSYEALPDPNIATGGFIIENPAPQTDYTR